MSFQQPISLDQSIVPNRLEQTTATTPPGPTYVGAGSLWENPFVAGEPSGIFPHRVLIPSLNYAKSNQLYRLLLSGTTTPEMHRHGVNWMRRWNRHHTVTPMELLARLRGEDLACSCPADEGCYADVLLEMANL